MARKDDSGQRMALEAKLKMQTSPMKLLSEYTQQLMFLVQSTKSHTFQVSSIAYIVKQTCLAAFSLSINSIVQQRRSVLLRL